MNTTLLEVSAVAYQYGPFFFAVFFTLVVTRWAHKTYRDGYTNPGTPAEAKQTYRVILVATFTFSCCLVVVAIWFYFMHPPSNYVFEGTIDNLDGYETVRSGDLYLKDIYKGPLPGSDLQFHDDHFIAYQPIPFTPEQRFGLLYSKQGGTTEPLFISYTSEPNPRFKIEFNEQSSKAEIKAVPIAHAGFVTSVYAAPEPVTQYQNAKPSQEKSLKDNIPTVYGQQIGVLQEESTGVGRKIFALDSLTQTLMPSAPRTGSNFFSNPLSLDIRTSKEPFTITLLDLSRHSDKELAFKAARLIDLMHLDEVIEADLVSKNEQDRRDAEAALFHMDKGRAEKILKESHLLGKQRRQQLLHDVSVANARLPIPTGSSQGDRYYIQAEGDTPAGVQCINKIFSKDDSLFTAKQNSIQSNQPPNPKPVITDFYDSKTKALAAYDDIERCGGKAAFITPPRGAKD
jgi:hypothetical protein